MASLFCAVGLVSALASCSPENQPGPAPAETEPCSEIRIDRFKELIIVDEGVVGDARSRNATNGAWSFRRRIEDMAPDTGDPADVAVKWLSVWKAPTQVNLQQVPIRPFVDAKALCRWQRSLPSNECDAGCTACKERKFDLALAPFRLVAITNRADLVTIFEDPSTAGEVRFTYALTDGPGDDPASVPLNFTVIFEYRQPLLGRTRREVANAWHALGRFTDFGEPFKAELDSLLSTFVKKGIEPSRPFGSSIAQIRTNDREFDWQWDLREFTLTEAGIKLHTTENTPAESLNGSTQLIQFLKSNESAIRAGKHKLPETLSGGSVGIISKWVAPEVDSSLVASFSAETCNGCHQNQMTDFNFHISPFKKGTEKLSTFLHNPRDPTHDTAATREKTLQRMMCGTN